MVELVRASSLRAPSALNGITGSWKGVYESDLPAGTLAVGVGLVLNGLATYLFLVIAKRVLPDDGADKLTGSSGRAFLMRGIRSNAFSSGMITSVMTTSPSPRLIQLHNVEALLVARDVYPARASA